MIDVITTAIRRPELLDLTYKSFFKNLIGLPRSRLIINVDPLGDGDFDTVMDVANRYFDEVISRDSDSANFARAVNWCYQRVTADWILHLEDDWLLRRPIHLTVLLDECRKTSISQIVLPMKNPRSGNSRYSFRPHISKSNVLLPFFPLPENVNPEKYLASKSDILKSADLQIPYLVQDTGRKWAKARGVAKSNNVEQEWFSKRALKFHYLAKLEYFSLKIYWRLRYCSD